MKLKEKPKEPSKGLPKGSANGSSKGLKDSLKGKKSLTWVLKTFLLISIGGSLLGIVGVGAFFIHFSKDLPKIITVEDYKPWTVTRVFGGNGQNSELLGEFYKQRRYLVPIEKIPEPVFKAFVAAEDDQFFQHKGINLVSIVRAGIANFKAGHVVQGGSTITQQVAKSLLLTPEKSMSRKVKEVILSNRIEKNLTKQQILYLYLNQIYLGHGAYGVQAASRTYFRKDVGEISLAEAAVLAGLPQAPGKYSPVLNPKRAKERQLYVLRRMYESKFISQSEMNAAMSEPVRIFNDEDINTKYAAYYVEAVRRYLLDKYGEDAVYTEGLTVNVPTTRELSLASSKNVREGLYALDKRMGYRGPIQHLKTQDQVENYLLDLRVRLIEKKLHYQLLMPDGRLDPVEAMHRAGLTKDVQLLSEGEIYQAVVTQVDDKAKRVGVMLGGVTADLPLANMKWARLIKEENGTRILKAEPSVPSKILARGDVVLVRIMNIAEKGTTVALEQEPQVQGALLSLDAKTGYVLAMEGGFDFEQSEFNRAMQAQRQPGSSFKPLIYAAALEKGYTPATIIVDSPIVYEDAETGKWKPSNFEEKFYGDTTFRQALIKSRNVPTIKIVQAIQIPFLIDYAKRLGLNAQYSPDLSISLGSASASLLELTKVYALFPRLGRKVEPIFWTKIMDREGKVLEENKPKPFSVPLPWTEASPQPAPAASPGVNFPKYPLANDPDQVMDPRVAYVMTHLMNEVVTYGTGHEAKNLGRSAAGKTGTTNDYIDAWFMGFTPQVVTGVWVGFDGQKTMGPGETGAHAALPIWLGYMKEAVKPYPIVDFTIPPGVVFATINASTGKLASPNASGAIKEAFIQGTQPTAESGSGNPAANSEIQSEFFKEDVE